MVQPHWWRGGPGWSDSCRLPRSATDASTDVRECMTHHVIAGFGIAGRAAARWLLRNAPDDRVTIIAGETAPFYPRHNLHHFLAGDIVEGELFDRRWSSSGTSNERLS